MPFSQPQLYVDKFDSVFSTQPAVPDDSKHATYRPEHAASASHVKDTDNFELKSVSAPRRRGRKRIIETVCQH